MPFRSFASFAVVVAALCAGIVVAAKPFRAAAQQPPQLLRMIIQSHPDVGQKCLNIAGAQFVAGMRLQTFDCNNQNEEIFGYDQGAQRLIIGHLCVESWGRGDSADAVGLGVCSDAPSQKWRMSASGDYYQIVGMNNRCLEIRTGLKGSGAPLDIANCQAGAAGELWALIEAPTAQPSRCTHFSLHNPGGGDIEFMRTASDEWVNHFVTDGKSYTFTWHLQSESQSELLLYDRSRDRYARVDLSGRKTYARNGSAGGWGAPFSDIFLLDC